MVKGQSLFHVSVAGNKHEFIFNQCMQCTPSLDDLDTESLCILLRWATEDEVDHTLTCDPRNVDILRACKWFGIEPWESVLGTVHLLCSNFAVSPFIEELPWSNHRFYLNRFYRYFK